MQVTVRMKVRKRRRKRRRKIVKNFAVTKITQCWVVPKSHADPVGVAMKEALSAYEQKRCVLKYLIFAVEVSCVSLSPKELEKQAEQELLALQKQKEMLTQLLEKQKQVEILRLVTGVCLNCLVFRFKNWRRNKYLFWK